jgi:peptide/nickel transport system substrate-binding protein
MRTRFSTRAGIIAVTAALLAACGGGSSDSGGGSGDAAAEEGEPRSGGTASLLQLTEPRTLDPAVMNNASSGNTLVGNSLFGQLVTVDEEGVVEPGLAESVETTDGGTTWKLTLREGLTFSDGSAFDAAAVQFNWERIKNPATGSQAILAASYVGSMTATGQTLEFTLTVPIAQFESTVAESLNWIASPAALQAGNQAFDAAPVGAGPFVLKSWQRNGQMVLARNENYWDAPRPYLDELVLTANGDAQQRFSTLTSGAVDGSLFSNPDIFALAEEQGLNTATQELNGAIALSMNTRVAPFDDVRARQAVAMGVDRDAVNAAAYAGEAEVPEALFREGSPYNGDTKLPTYDQDAAQELFDELADEGKPVEFTITAVQTTENRRVTEAVQAQLNQYDNVSVELEVLDFPAYAAANAQRSFEMTAGGLTFSNPAPLLYTNLHSTTRGNVTGISDPELDAALEAGLAASDEDSRVEAYQEVAALFTELSPYLTYIRSNFSTIYEDRLHGVEYYGTGAVRTDLMWVSE